jgi:ABC-2 type transport system ATP-binding protein
MTEMIALERLSKQFGDLLAVDRVTLGVARGEVLGFLGPNGAGKTTTMRMVAGFLEPTGGTARICGFDVADRPIEAKRRLGYLPEGAPLYGDMTPAALLDFVAGLRGFGGREKSRRIAEVVEKVTLGDVLDRPIESLSKGFKRRVGLAQAMLHDPEVLVLDEPTDGLDPNQKHHVRELIRAMSRDKAIVVSTHILEEVETICTRAVVIARGRVVADGTAESLLRQLPRHNAVRVSVPVVEAGPAQAALATVVSPPAVEAAETGGGLATFWVHAGDESGALLGRVAHALHAADVTVEALTIERGRLDEVFRTLTLGEQRENRDA